MKKISRAFLALFALLFSGCTSITKLHEGDIIGHRWTDASDVAQNYIQVTYEFRPDGRIFMRCYPLETGWIYGKKAWAFPAGTWRIESDELVVQWKETYEERYLFRSDGSLYRPKLPGSPPAVWVRAPWPKEPKARLGRR